LTIYHRLHSWDVSEKKAVLFQDRLASVTSTGGSAGPVSNVAGCDAAYDLSSGKAFAAVCVFAWDLKQIERLLLT
jgi:deoxyinosine 3'endonuclease (endonuclease V)